MTTKDVITFGLGLAIGIGVGIGGSRLMTKPPTAEEPAVVATDEQQDVQVEDAQSGEAEEAAGTDGTSVLLSGFEWPRETIGDALPEPQFGVAPSHVSTGGSTASVTYNDVDADVANAYIEEVKSLGYVYDVIESKSNVLYSYSARNGDDIVTCSTVNLSYGEGGSFRISWNGPYE